MNGPELLIRSLGSSALIRDYLAGAPSLAPFYPGQPHDRSALHRVAEAVNAKFTLETRRAMREAITPTSEAAAVKLEEIAMGRGFFVSTGQQAGLFTGPAFTLYKTLSTIMLAQTYEKELGLPVAPLFWVAADDHDFAEVNHTLAVGPDGDLKRIEIGGAGEKQHSMHLQPLDESVTAAVEQFAAAVPASEFTDRIMGWLRDAYVPGFSVASAFKQVMEQIFAGHDLLVTSSADPNLKSLAAPVILRELDAAESNEAAIRAQTDRLIAAGYHEQVTVRSGAANVLYEDEEGRDRLTRDGEGWTLARTKRRFTHSDLRDQLTLQPERFSPNVMLRPVVASAVFPTLAYVGGPAEVSYFGQIGCLFAAHDVVMPLVQPRVSIDIVEGKIQKVLDKFSLSVDDVRQPLDQLTSRVMRDALPDEVTDTIARLRENIGDSYDELVRATESIDPTLRGPLENTRNISQKSLVDIEKKIVSHLKKKNEIGVEQLRKASVNLFPNGAPQERVINGLTYLARYGTEMLDTMLGRIKIEMSDHTTDWSGVRC
jgi:bacillithiol biosynthesis cysteine-adding enzyme BshC